MSDIDNTNELDSYGVWVKQPGKENNVEDLDSTDVFDLPDFPETSLDTDNLDDFLNDIEDTPVDAPAEEIAVEEASEEVSEFDDIMSDFEVEEPAPEAQPELSEPESFDVDSFMEEDSPVEESAVEETVEESSEDDFQLPEEDGEISLDEFMDGDFSDESVAAGNNGFSEEELASQNAASATEEVSFEDGELSLDDFLDGGEFTMAPEEVEPKKEEVIEEKPLEMDISFDAEADTVATEDNVELDLDALSAEQNEVDGGEEARSTEVSGDTEEIDLSDFGIDSEADETPINQDVDAAKAKDKVVDYDLSVGDEKTSSAPVVNEIKEITEEEAAPAPQAAAVPEGSEVVSSDLLRQIIADLSGLKNEINTLKTNLETMKSAPAPVVEEEPVVEETIIEETPVFEEEPVIEETPVIEDTIIEDTPVFEETVVEEPVVEEEPVIEETPVFEEEPVIEETAVTDEDLDFEIDAPAEESAGFFGDDDGDDTIALSGNELDNIMSSVEFTEAEAEEVNEEPTEEVIEEAPVIEEENTEIPVVTDDISDAFVSKLEGDEVEFAEEKASLTDESLDIIETSSDDNTGFFGDDDGDDTIALSGNELDNILNTADFTEENASEEISDEGIDFSPADEEENFEINDTLEEPDLDSISIIEEEDELPEEISIPKADDILVESSNTDLLDSVKDSSEDNVSDFDNFMAEDKPSEITDDTIDFLSEEIPEDALTEMEEEVSVEEPVIEEAPVFEEEPVADEPVVEIEENEEPVLEETAVEEPALEDDFGSVDTIFEEETVEETPVEDVPVEEPVVEEEPVVAEPAPVSVEVPVEAPAAEPAPAPAEPAVNSSLQNDIKSVLLYMDQLLENLPEEKIVEFAKSEEFATYKKLFNELGLA
ncbi:MAG: hypothetical protein MJ176_00315 [Treponema sp.]|nr:hypothetical protein [Treponema sp.]